MFDRKALYDSLVDLVVSFGPKLLGAAAILWFGLRIARWIMKGIEKILHRGIKDVTLVHFLTSLIHLIIKVVVVLVACSVIGVPMSSFIALLGAAGLAVGLALQGSLSNFAGGVLILFFKPYRVGDYIEAQGEEGIVEEISIFVTSLVTPENKVVTIPNGALANGNIINYTKKAVRRVDVMVGIAYDEDVHQAKKVLQGVIDATDVMVNHPGTGVYMNELADSSVNLIVRGYCKPQDYWTAFFELTEGAKIALDDAGISIPFPHRVVHTVNSL